MGPCEEPFRDERLVFLRCPDCTFCPNGGSKHARSSRNRSIGTVVGHRVRRRAARPISGRFERLCSGSWPSPASSRPRGATSRPWLPKDVSPGSSWRACSCRRAWPTPSSAGLPPITGLYTSIMCLLGYAVFGPSRILVLGPDSSLGPMIAATILPLVGAGGDPERAIALASVLALMVGAIMILGGRRASSASSPTCCRSRP